ncbi:hypothetical protein [Brachybacterium sacelli]|uniref:hypothetical protein n=1 Tax=Brachybacterium sacelli TaxID=173364 RepID=UPI0036149E2B
MTSWHRAPDGPLPAPPPVAAAVDPPPAICRRSRSARAPASPVPGPDTCTERSPA